MRSARLLLGSKRRRRRSGALLVRKENNEQCSRCAALSNSAVSGQQQRRVRFGALSSATRTTTHHVAASLARYAPKGAKRSGAALLSSVAEEDPVEPQQRDNDHRGTPLADSETSSAEETVFLAREKPSSSSRELQDKRDEQQEEDLPPPLPEPKYSVRRRVLPDHLVPLNSPAGRTMLLEALMQCSAASYIPLTEQFINQSDPAFCGVSTLVMVLNGMSVDPNIRWKGGWRFYGNEDVLLSQCCLSSERIRRIGISMHQFQQLAHCQGLHVVTKHARPHLDDDDDDDEEEVEADDAVGDLNHPLLVSRGTTGSYFSLEEFRHDVRHILCEDHECESCPPTAVSAAGGMLVASYCRSALGQTGEGHFSPLAAYHAPSDRCLVLDVARFKYQPHWVRVDDLYSAMRPADTAGTGQPRGWYLLYPPARAVAVAAAAAAAATTANDNNNGGGDGVPPGEDRRPAHLVPLMGKDEIPCPLHTIKVDYCQARHNHNTSSYDPKTPKR